MDASVCCRLWPQCRSGGAHLGSSLLSLPWACRPRQRERERDWEREREKKPAESRKWRIATVLRFFLYHIFSSYEEDSETNATAVIALSLQLKGQFSIFVIKYRQYVTPHSNFTDFLFVILILGILCLCTSLSCFGRCMGISLLWTVREIQKEIKATQELSYLCITVYRRYVRGYIHVQVNSYFFLVWNFSCKNNFCALLFRNRF